MRKLLRDHGLEGNKRRRRLAGGAGSGADDEGPVLMEVAVEQLEELYARLVAEDDYLEKVSLLMWAATCRLNDVCGEPCICPGCHASLWVSCQLLYVPSKDCACMCVGPTDAQQAATLQALAPLGTKHIMCCALRIRLSTINLKPHPPPPPPPPNHPHLAALQMAEELSEHDATPAAVLATLRHHGIVQRPAARARTHAGGGGRRKGLSRADALLLEELWEEHGEEEDALNLVAMQMPGGYTVQEVGRGGLCCSKTKTIKTRKENLGRWQQPRCPCVDAPVADASDDCIAGLGG